MEKSIETIWTKGFLNEEELIAPKINNLYNRKSKLLIEKLKRTYRADNMSIIPLSVISVVGFGLAGYGVLGLYLMVLMMSLFFLNRRKLAKLESIRIESSSYQYLLEYREIFTGFKKFYIRLLGIGVPVAGLTGYYLFFRNSPVMESFLSIQPFKIVLILLGISLSLSAMGVFVYLLTTKLVYGSLIKKLDEMIAEMKDLRS
ncbi:hypothetical protein JKA74_10730 [Marivirga sp. S37H4]|uniref:Uncharacterized protein n=1 Tax=Marivirga aurantiaca TaxID=2802615 RepID=A0A935CBR3_9BACT|nr:hypothetical protein [Marivirga aurantiaca]MBK6265513.1 hypothetical protein [Marivirga aurantiaca]